MIKSAFTEKYADCQISAPPEYKVKNVNSPVFFCVDCVYRKKPNSGGDRCDEFIFFYINRSVTGIHLIERKAGSVDVGKVRKQLQGGADFIADFITEDRALDEYRHKFDFMPVLVSVSLSPSQLKNLIALKISLIGKSKHIHHVKNGRKLPKV